MSGRLPTENSWSLTNPGCGWMSLPGPCGPLLCVGFLPDGTLTQMPVAESACARSCERSPLALRSGSVPGAASQRFGYYRRRSLYTTTPVAVPAAVAPATARRAEGCSPLRRCINVMYKLFIGLGLPPDPSSKSREARLPERGLNGDPGSPARQTGISDDSGSSAN